MSECEKNAINFELIGNELMKGSLRGFEEHFTRYLLGKEVNSLEAAFLLLILSQIDYEGKENLKVKL